MLIVFILGCVKIPDYLVDPMSYPHEQCPVEQHIMAIGIDEDSSDRARENARKRVGEQILSSISTTQPSVESMHNTNDTSVSEEGFFQQSKVNVDFEYDDLIKDISEVHKSRDGYRALACLSLVELEKTILLKQEKNISQIFSLFSEQSQIPTEFNPSMFVFFSYKRALIYKQLNVLVGDLVFLRRLLGRSTPVELEIQEKLDLMEVQTKELRQIHPIYLSPDRRPANEIRVTRLEARLLQELQEEGLVVKRGECQSIKYGACSSVCPKDVDGIALELSTILRSDQNAEGEVAYASSLLKINDCAVANKQRESAFYNSSSIRNPYLIRVKGYHPTDAEIAKEAALENLLKSELLVGIGEVLPIQSISK